MKRNTIVATLSAAALWADEARKIGAPRERARLGRQPAFNSPVGLSELRAADPAALDAARLGHPRLGQPGPRCC